MIFQDPCQYRKVFYFIVLISVLTPSSAPIISISTVSKPRARTTVGVFCTDVWKIRPSTGSLDFFAYSRCGTSDSRFSLIEALPLRTHGMHLKNSEVIESENEQDDSRKKKFPPSWQVGVFFYDKIDRTFTVRMIGGAAKDVVVSSLSSLRLTFPIFCTSSERRTIEIVKEKRKKIMLMH